MNVGSCIADGSQSTGDTPGIGAFLDNTIRGDALLPGALPGCVIGVGHFGTHPRGRNTLTHRVRSFNRGAVQQLVEPVIDELTLTKQNPALSGLIFGGVVVVEALGNHESILIHPGEFIPVSASTGQLPGLVIGVHHQPTCRGIKPDNPAGVVPDHLHTLSSILITLLAGVFIGGHKPVLIEIPGRDRLADLSTHQVPHHIVGELPDDRLALTHARVSD